MIQSNILIFNPKVHLERMINVHMFKISSDLDFSRVINLFLCGKDGPFFKISKTNTLVSLRLCFIHRLYVSKIPYIKTLNNINRYLEYT